MKQWPELVLHQIEHKYLASHTHMKWGNKDWMECMDACFPFVSRNILIFCKEIMHPPNHYSKSYRYLVMGHNLLASFVPYRRFTVQMKALWYIYYWRDSKREMHAHTFWASFYLHEFQPSNIRIPFKTLHFCHRQCNRLHSLGKCFDSFFYLCMTQKLRLRLWLFPLIRFESCNASTYSRYRE